MIHCRVDSVHFVTVRSGNKGSVSQHSRKLEKLGKQGGVNRLINALAYCPRNITRYTFYKSLAHVKATHELGFWESSALLNTALGVRR